jgi:hypothetical protein
MQNSQVEKEVKYYQGEVAAALAARDKAIVEVERVHEGEKIMTTKMQEIQARYDKKFFKISLSTHSWEHVFFL